MMDLTEKDLKQLEEKGISKEKVLQQIETFGQGIPFVTLEKAAVMGNGILKVKDAGELISYYENNIEDKTILKFVPASGAASRMFKAMFNFVGAFDPSKETLGAYFDRTGDRAAKQFVEGMDKFPFYNDLLQKIDGKYGNRDEKAHLFVSTMLAEDGLNFGSCPKGLLPFHKCKHGSATPYKEHLKEAALYAKTNGRANLHFTISPQHQQMFKDEEEISVPRISQKTDTRFNVSYSFQKPSTDTVAVTMDNALFRTADGNMLFRPGGHGALIENLNEQEADLIFIKNIDNVAVDNNLEVVGNNKKMLGGLLLQLQGATFAYANELDADPNAEKINEIASFVTDQLNVVLPNGFPQMGNDAKQSVLKKYINRPIRICGMVKNEGEPGGGPFWVSDAKGNISLQIIEKAQIDLHNAEQAALLKNSTHFNPVDIICGVKDHKGKKYNLLEHVDPKQGFITKKTIEGKEIKALELPGLWNGAMAFWNTIFVEVPLGTFNPVKSVNDLLKPSHQG